MNDTRFHSVVMSALCSLSRIHRRFDLVPTSRALGGICTATLPGCSPLTHNDTVKSLPRSATNGALITLPFAMRSA